MNPRRCLTAKETWLLQIVKLYLQNNGRLSSFSFSLLASSPLMELYVLGLEEIGFVRSKDWLFLYDNVSSMYTLSKFLKRKS